MYRLVKNDIDKAAEMMARAFLNDPAWIAIAPDEDHRFEQLIPIFQYGLVYGLKYGEIYSPTEAIEGVSLWLPPRLGRMSLWRSILAGCLSYGLKIEKDTLGRMSTIFRGIDKKRDYYTEKSDIYLFILAVEPELQGQGYGSAMLKFIIDRADKEGQSIYLETEPDENVSYYRKFGFTVVEEMDMSQYGFMFRFCLRKPH